MSEWQQLEDLLWQAWLLRDSPYLRDACEAVVDWYELWEAREAVRREEREWTAVRLARFLRSTYPGGWPELRGRLDEEAA